MSAFVAYRNRDFYINDFTGWVKTMRPDAFITLTFKFDVTENEARACMKQFVLHISRASFSKKQFKRGERIRIFPFMEQMRSGRLHYHLLLRLPPKYQNRVGAFKDRVRKYWLRVRAKDKINFALCGGNPFLLDKNGAKWFRYEKRGFSNEFYNDVVHYLLKELRITDNGSLDALCVDAENVHI
ncbi:MAG: hypothetical protein LRY36_02585 [Alphaproteobacteria bacterium]|nr:hypothetical protein [Alphaproteobacteria bacterium]